MNGIDSLVHTKWECKYHIVWIPKYRRKVLYKQIRRHLGDIFHSLAAQRESQILQGSIAVDHVHICIAIPPKYSVSQVVGYIKGKSAIYIARTFGGRDKNFRGESFWARGYYVSTVGKDEDLVKAYIREQEGEYKKSDQLKLWS